MSSPEGFGHLTVKEAPVTPLLNDSQVANAVSNKMLQEVHTALTSTAKPEEIAADRFVHNEIMTLISDPQGPAVFRAMAQKIEHHDPALGTIQGHVERSADGHITAFSFTDPGQESRYHQHLNAQMLQGHTKQEALRNFNGEHTHTDERDLLTGTIRLVTSYPYGGNLVTVDRGAPNASHPYGGNGSDNMRPTPPPVADGKKNDWKP